MNSNLELAFRNQLIPTSCVRSILSNQKDLISLAGGIPNPSAIPNSELNFASQNVFQQYGAKALGYGPSEGEYELRRWIAQNWLNKQGIHAHADQIILTQGSQQALDLIAKVYIDPQSSIAVERPTYLAALQAFSAYEPQFLEWGGKASEIIEQIALQKTKTRFFYCIPNFQNPTGQLMDLELRHFWAEILQKYQVPLIEDDPYGSLYYESCPPQPIHSLGNLQGVLLGTFSKMIAPGLRIGWIWSPNPHLYQAILRVKQAADLCGSRFMQLLTLTFLQEFDLDDHLKKVRRIHCEQRDLMTQILEKYLAKWATWKIPQGGMFFWISLRASMNGIQLRDLALKHGVAIADGASFYAKAKDPSTIRLNFTQCDMDSMERGIKTLANLLEHR